MATSESSTVPGPPYPPTVALLGGVPTLLPDMPITATFLLLFILGAVANFTIFKMNMKQAHKFFLSMFMFGFCMCRIVTMSLRIAWANDPTNVRLGIAAMIFVAAGTILLFVINVVFAQRIIRAQHPNWGWHRAFGIAFKALIALILLTLAMLIAVTVQSFYTLDANTHRIDRDVQLYGSTFYTAVAFLPIPLVVFGLLLPRRIRVEKFGIGRFRTKVCYLLLASFLLTLGAAWRCGTLYARPVPRTAEPWYFHKTFFYIFDFGVEAIVVLIYILVRVDRRFHIPDGAKGPGAYRSGTKHEHKHHSLPAHPGDFGHTTYHGSDGFGPDQDYVPLNTALRIYSEEELFDDTATLAETLRYNATSLELDGASGKWMLKSQSAQSLYSDPFGDSHNGHSRGSDKTAGSNVYSDISMQKMSSASTGRYEADDVEWEAISAPNAYAPSFKSHERATSMSSTMPRYSLTSIIERPERAQGDTREYLTDDYPPAYSGISQGMGSPPSTSRKSLKSMKSAKSVKGTKRVSIDEKAFHHKLESNERRKEASEQDGLMNDSGDAAPSLQQKRKSSWRRSVESQLQLNPGESPDTADDGQMEGSWEKTRTEAGNFKE